MMSDVDSDTGSSSSGDYTDYSGYVGIGGETDVVNNDVEVDLDLDVDYIIEMGVNVDHDVEDVEEFDDHVERINVPVVDVDIHPDITNLCQEAGIDHHFKSMDDAQYFVRLSQCKAHRSFKVVSSEKTKYIVKCAHQSCTFSTARSLPWPRVCA